MEQPHPPDRTAADGPGRDHPGVSVAGGSGPADPDPASGTPRTDPVHHDLYRRPPASSASGRPPTDDPASGHFSADDPTNGHPPADDPARGHLSADDPPSGPVPWLRESALEATGEMPITTDPPGYPDPADPPDDDNLVRRFLVDHPAAAPAAMSEVSEEELYPPFTLVDDLFLRDEGPDLPIPVTAVDPVNAGGRYGPVPVSGDFPGYEEVQPHDPEGPFAAGLLRPERPSVLDASIHPPRPEPRPARKRRLIGLRSGTFLAVLLVAVPGLTAVAVAVMEAGGYLGTETRRTAEAPSGRAAGAGGAPVTRPGAGADVAPGTPGGPGPVETVAAEPVDPVAAHSVSAPRDGREQASFDLVNGTTTVNLQAADLGDVLYNVSTPLGSNVLPRAVQQRDRTQLHLVRSGEEGPGAVEITLNSEVRWALRIIGGAAEHVIDMSDGQLTGVEIAGGATRIDLSLPEASGTVKVRMTGGVNQFAVNTPPGTPVRLRIGSGAAQVVLDGRAHRGIAPGRVFSPHRWTNVDDRVDLDAVAGVGTLTLSRS